MFTLKQLNEKLGDARKRKSTLVNDRASKINELEMLMDKDSPDQESIEGKQNEIKNMKAKIEQSENLIINYTDQIQDLNDVNNYEAPNAGFAFESNGESSEGKELQSYSMIDAIRQGMGRGNFTGLVAEMHQEGQREAKESGISLSGNGLVIPQKVLANKKFDMRNDVTAGTAGAKTIQTEGIDFVSLLRSRLVLSQLGARFVTGLSGNIPLTNQAGGFTFGWAATENATASESTATYNQQTLSPKRGTGFMDVSNQWLIQTSPEIEQELVNDILSGTAVGIQTAAINGAGSNGEPEGILQKSGIGIAYAGGAAATGTNANGAAQAYDDWVNVAKEVAVDNADMGSLAYLTNPKVKAQAMLTKIDAGSGNFIWDKMKAMDSNIGISNIVPSDLSKGTSDDLSPLIYGNFRDLWIGQWGGLELMPNPYTKAKDAITEMILHVYVDVATRREESFAAVKDIDAQ